MSTSTKTPASIRHGGPGASHENAKDGHVVRKPPADDERDRRSQTSGGGGEADRHHTHDPEMKGGGSRPSSQVHPRRSDRDRMPTGR
ncbi:MULTISPECIES: hypothetical protein [unclassified Chelatococcus]|uniref:hypothetical protein n=1 Tax=unclassified Chelatococcus TaxID=2638111 RepID=UPI0025BC8B28|nr:hypothetical protein [Chelatococcus sp.]MCO5078807.1 hypothetical protein [Chelatococcus sp.]